MSKKIITLGIALCSFSLVTTTTSCKKVVDCLAEESLTSIDVSIDPANSKQYTFKVSYGGTHTLSTVNWKFGDGSEATSNGADAVTHTFQEGTFKVIAETKITGDDKSCNPVVTKSIVVN